MLLYKVIKLKVLISKYKFYYFIITILFIKTKMKKIRLIYILEENIVKNKIL